MSRLSSPLFAVVALLAGWAVGAGCYSSVAPQLTVLGVQPTAKPQQQVVFVQVTNQVGRTLRLQRLEYTFAASGSTKAWPAQVGELTLARDVPAGSTVVLEVPLRDEGAATGPVTLSGHLITERDRIETSYPIHAAVPAVR